MTAPPDTSVLVVDDEQGMRETLVDILEGAGYGVDTANDGNGALARVRDGGFDVVVMDIKMPGRDGVSVLREVDGPPPEVILMTAYALEEQLRGAIDAKAYAVVHKPFHVAHLLRLVAGAANRPTDST
ncbi:MAG TPA: response regulator [Acidimicrobiales bacterium]|jgi:two-component system nitrogen regulation response regulator NtrX|nr:response regulator [Acidimicrobiales bacterium]